MCFLSLSTLWYDHSFIDWNFFSGERCGHRPLVVIVLLHFFINMFLNQNKDGLLYVDVQFDAKKGNENPVIHGEDEKTDYATVEFPMPSSSQEDASADK